jgi:hypothetical protein
VTRTRLRPAHAPEKLAEIYAEPHDHTRWSDHRLRVAATVELARWLTADEPIAAAADLSCGDGVILRSLDGGELHFGDFAPGYDHTGPIEQTITEIPPVDLFVCAETIEHLDDPDKVLAGIRAKARMLVLSTPVDAWFDRNPEHYWAWSRADVEAMAQAAGFHPVVYTAVDFRPLGPQHYQFGIWGLR